MFFTHRKLFSDRKEEFFRLYVPLKDRLLRYAVQVAGNADDGWDLANEAMIKAYENFDRVRLPDSFLYLLFKIVVRLHHRGRRRNARVFRGELHEHAVPVAHGPHADDLADAALLCLAMQQLPERQRMVVTLHHIVGLKFEEIAVAENRSVDAVKKDCSRARQRLAQILGVEADKPSSRTPSSASPDNFGLSKQNGSARGGMP